MMRARSLPLWVTVTVILLAAAQAAAQMGAIAVRAKGTQEWEGNVWHAREDVVITYQDVRIQCQSVELDRATGDIKAEGDVILDRGLQRFTADRLLYNLKTKSGTFMNATGTAPPSYSFTGAILERIDETHYRIIDGTFTACEQERPAWDFHLREALIEDEGYGRFKGVAFRIKRLPVLYFPYLLWPVKTERAAGLMMPGFGYSERRGFYLGTRLFVPLGRSYDTTINIDWFTKNYYGLGTEFRWAPTQGAYGEVYAYTVRDPNDGLWQWKIDGMHRQENVLGFSLSAEVHEMSDNDFFQEFENDVHQNTRRYLYSQILATRSRGPATLNLRLDRRVTFLTADDVMQHQLPEAEIRVRSNRVSQTSFYWNMVSSVNVFNVDRGGDLKGTYARADLFPEISYTLPGPTWLTVTPSMGGRATWYSSRYTEDRKAFEETPISKTYVLGRLDMVGPSFSRIFDLDNDRGTRVKHLIEPRLVYQYLSDPGDDMNLIPLFDEVDSTPITNRATLTLANRLYVKSRKSPSAREVASLDFFQTYSFSDPLSYGADGRTSQRSPYGLALRVVPVMGTSIDTRASFDALTNKLRSTSLSASVFKPSYNVGITWYDGYSATTGEKTSSQTQVRFGLKKADFPLSFDVHVAYDVEKALVQQQRYGLGWKGSCWGLRAEYRDLKSATYPARDYRLVISLKGIGELPAIKGSLGQ